MDIKIEKQISPPEKENENWKIDIPKGDNNLFISIFLSYLISVKKDDSIFKIRFTNLFGEMPADVFEKTKKLISDYNPFKTQTFFTDNQSFMSLLAKAFYDRVKNFSGKDHADCEYTIDLIAQFLGCDIQLFNGDQPIETLSAGGIYPIKICHEQKSYKLILSSAQGNVYAIQSGVNAKKAIQPESKKSNSNSTKQIEASESTNRNLLFRLTNDKFISIRIAIQEIETLASKLSTNIDLKEKATIIIKIHELLSSIPFKYGRSNLCKSKFGTWKASRLLDSIGLPYLAKELKNASEDKIAKILNNTLIDELSTGLVLASRNFLFYQFREEYLAEEKFVTHFEVLENEVFELKKLVVTSFTADEESNFKEENKKTAESIKTLTNRIKLLKMDIEDNSELPTEGKIKALEAEINKLKSNLEGLGDKKKITQEQQKITSLTNALEYYQFRLFNKSTPKSEKVIFLKNLENEHLYEDKKSKDNSTLMGIISRSKKESVKKENPASIEKAKKILSEKQLDVSRSRNEIDLSTITFPLLNEYQIDFEKRTAAETLLNFRRNLKEADTNICIISSIINFVGWQKEYCSDEISNRIEIIVPKAYLQSFRGLRNRAMHSLDNIVRLNKVTSTETKSFLEGAKHSLLEIIECLLDDQNIAFLQNQKNTNEFTIHKFPETPENNAIMNSIDSTLPKNIEYKKELDANEQVEFFENSTVNALSIIKLLKEEIQKDEKGDVSLKDITIIVGKEDKDLNSIELKIKMRYDALMQALGQAIGNLQQYTELKEIERLPINIAKFKHINQLVPDVKDYRSSRTHNGYYNCALFNSALTEIYSHYSAIIEELTVLKNDVLNHYSDKNANVTESSCRIS